ncbi:DUF7219 family protein [Brunnivagina elsteri]|uniref:Isopropylmalate/homocitrate/citramalate synthase n=1 Tax=Brunnivagina elsteri CCALA 953 TaxID=987040 RepID=A0A2A2TNV4_9CYAN|nr:hypothetical protein [Calothrix elsteri]PAX60191.1 hypothetical protein CK510_03210 [Calothrix elsteri CCALA 953]
MLEESHFPINLNNFLYLRYPYHGKFSPEHLVFDANLQEFSQRVGYICNLETSGKLPPEEAYAQLKMLWKQLKRTKKELGIGGSPLE